jgi:hypothetical protein
MLVCIWFAFSPAGLHPPEGPIFSFDMGVTLSHPHQVVTFVETSTFTRLITELVDDADYATFQRELADQPEKGVLMKECGGVRKIRLAVGGRGKSGGARVNYLFLKNRDTIYLLYLFTKGDADNLSPEGKKKMHALAQQIKNEFK